MECIHKAYTYATMYMSGLVTEMIDLFKGITVQTFQTEQCVTYDEKIYETLY